MPNAKWMSYSFVRLYLFKCDVCVLIFRWIKPKRFLIILYVFGSDFYHSLCSCNMLTFFFFFFNCLSMFYVEKTSVRIFGYLFWWLASREIQSRFLTTHFGDLQAARPSHEFTQNGFATQLATCQLRIAQKQLFKELFVRKLF